MVTKAQRKRINNITDNIIAGIMKSIMIQKLNRRIAYWRLKRMQVKKCGYTWRRCNRAIAATLHEIEEVLDPMWCKN